jgi:hypothetical protein
MAIAAGAVPNAFGQEAFDALEGCIKRLDPQTDLGYERIAARCPDLTRRLEASDWSPWLPRDWKAANNDLSAGSLRELRLLVARELATRPTSRTPDPAPLSGILAALGPMEPQQAGAWVRFTRWLRAALARSDPSSSAGWIDRMTLTPSQWVMEVVLYICLVMVIGLALGVIVNELRVAGLFAVRRRAAGSLTRLAANSAVDWSAIQNAPARERPRLLLELIAARLTDLNRLPAAGGLTVRELLHAARFAQAGDRTLLAELALAAERVRYAAEPVPDAMLHAAVERGRRLLEHLQA